MKKATKIIFTFLLMRLFIFSNDLFNENLNLNLNTTVEKSFDILAKIMDKNIILDEDVPKENIVNLRVRDMTAKNVLDIILQLNSLDYKEIDKNNFIIYPISKESKYIVEKTEIFYLNNIKADNMSNLLKANMGMFKIYIDPSLNSISVTSSDKKLEEIGKLIEKYDDDRLYSEKTFYLSYTTPQIVESYLSKFLFISDFNTDDVLNSITLTGRTTEIIKAEELIKKIDVKKSQVIIEIMLVEISESLSRSLGFTFTNMFKIVNAKTLFNEILDPATFIANQTSADAEILSNPSIRVINKERASINIGGRVPIIIAQNVDSSSDSYNVVPEVEYKNVGIMLEVIPTVHLNNDISINLSLEVSSVGETIETNYGSYPSFNTKNITTTIHLKDGQTAVFGGLISNEERESRVGVPFISDIPILGRLFSKTTTNPSKSEIVMFITPRVVNVLDEDKEEKNVE